MRGRRILARFLALMIAFPSGLSPSLLAMPRESLNVLWTPLPVARVSSVTPETIPAPSVGGGASAPGTLSFAQQGGDAITPRPECDAPLNEIISPGTSGLVAGRDDAAGFADAIVSLFRNPDFLRRMGEEGRRRVATEFSQARMVERTVRYYRDVIDRAGTHITHMH